MLLLDFDGVVVDSMALKVAAYLQIYAHESAEHHEAILAYQRSHAGETRRLKFRHFEAELFGRPATDEAIEALSAEYTRRVHDAVIACPLVAGAGEFLDCAIGQTVMHVVSGTPHEELEDIVRRRHLARYFASLHGAPATKPDTFRQLLQASRQAPDRVLAIGDGTTEYDAAIAAGIPFLGVVPPHEVSPFPAGVPVVASLDALGAALGFA